MAVVTELVLDSRSTNGTRGPADGVELEALALVRGPPPRFSSTTMNPAINPSRTITAPIQTARNRPAPDWPRLRDALPGPVQIGSFPLAWNESWLEGGSPGGAGRIGEGG